MRTTRDTTIRKLRLSKEADGTTPRLHEQFGYAYDAGGNLKTRTNNAFIQSFAVDAVNQLTNVTRTGTFTVSGNTSGRATNVTVNTSNAVLYADTLFASAGHNLVDGANTFTAIAKNAGGSSDTNVITAWLPAANSFTFDGNGNLTWDGQKAFEYDDENQLVRVTQTNVFKSEFVYDGRGRMRVRTEYGWVSGAWSLQSETRFIYDGMLVIQERDANNTPLVSYTRGRDLSGSFESAGGIGGLLARSDHVTTNSLLATALYHTDGNGNVTALLSTDGLVLAWYQYAPFGATLAQGGPLADANVYRFSSKMWHERSGLYYYGYRFYSPNLQRWLSRDPIQEEGSINLYQFVDNDPNGRVDWFGLKGAEDLCHRPTVDEVANNAGKSCNYKSRREDREYCGNVCRNNRTGRLSKTQTTGTQAGCNPGSAPCPAGTTLVAVWHTHGSNDPGYDNENFSDADRHYADGRGVPIFVRTPGCHTKKYTPGHGEVVLE